jgi:hypothetical protein
MVLLFCVWKLGIFEVFFFKYIKIIFFYSIKLFLILIYKKITERNFNRKNKINKEKVLLTG